jgi:hypothetical protein
MLRTIGCDKEVATYPPRNEIVHRTY